MLFSEKGGFSYIFLENGGSIPYLLASKKGVYPSEPQKRGSIRLSLPIHLFNGSAPPLGHAANQVYTYCGCLRFRLMVRGIKSVIDRDGVTCRNNNQFERPTILNAP